MTSQTHPIDGKGLEAAAKALIDADPSMSGHHETHVAAKIPYAKAAIRAYLEATTPTDQAELEVKVYRFEDSDGRATYSRLPANGFEPLVMRSQATTLLAEKNDRILELTRDVNRYAYERDKAREERNAAEGRSERFWKSQVTTLTSRAEAAEASLAKAVEVLKAVSDTSHRARDRKYYRFPLAIMTLVDAFLSEQKP